MSNQEPEQPVDDPWDDEAHFGASVLALPLSPELTSYAVAGAEKLDMVAAQQRIESIISEGVGSQVERRVMRRISEMIAKGIPEEHRTDRLIDSLDYRPYLQAAIDDGRMVKIGGADGAYTQQALEASMAAINAKNAQLAEDINIQTGTIGTEAQTTIRASQSFTTDEAGLAPSAAYGQAVAQVEGGQLAPGGVTEAVFGTTGFDETLNRPVWNEDEAIRLTQMPQTVFDTAIAYEADFNEKAGTPGMQRGGIIIETGAEPERIPVNRGPRKFPQHQPVAQNKVLSYSDAVNYLNTLTEDELADMQEKMAKAGYFDKIGSQYIRGDHDDEATFKAWEQLLMDSWTSKKGIDVTLIEEAKTARQKKQQLSMERWGTTDASRAAIEQAAVEILGRNLDANEFARVRDTIASLQQDRADDLVGVDSMGWYNQERAAQGWDEADVNDRIMREFGGEMAIQNSQDVRQKLKDVYAYSAPDFKEEEIN